MGNTIIKAYEDNLNFHQTLPKLHFTVPSNFGKVYPSKIDSNFGKAAFLRSPQTLPKLHFTVPTNFGKVYPSKNDSNFDSNFSKAVFYRSLSFGKVRPTCIPAKNDLKNWQGDSNFAKVAFYGPVELWQSFIQSFILATSTRLHPSLHFANYPINPVNRSLLCTFITGIIYIPVVILFGYDDFIEKG